MALKEVLNFERPAHSFNVTAIIDIVFLLIIFFLVVCRFIEAENFPVSVPDNCDFAQKQPRRGQVTTVTVMKTETGVPQFAVGPELLAATDYPAMTRQMAERLNAQLKDLPEKQRVVILRIDKDIRYADAQHVLAAVAASNAKDIQLATISETAPTQ
jgi:biopolymer transport protein ExbD